MTRNAPAPADWAARDARIRALEHWELRGRMAYKDAAGDGGQASLRWAQTAVVSRLRVAGPFGAGALVLLVEPERVTLTDARGERTREYRGADALQTFMQSQLGWSIPAAAARYWMLGIADPKAPAERERDASGRTRRLDQHGWQIEYQRFAQFDGLELPVKLALSGPQGRLRVVVTDWRLPAEPG